MVLTDLMWFFAIVWLGIMFWRHLGTAQIALNAATTYTRNQEVLLLDQSVHLKKLRLGLNAQRLPCLISHFAFEFTNIGDRRYTGEVELRGQKVHRIHLSPFVEHKH